MLLPVVAALLTPAINAPADGAGDSYLAEGKPVREVVRALTNRAGGDVRVDSRLAEDKVTVALSSSSFAEIRSVLAAVLDGEWSHRTVSGHEIEVLRPTDHREARRAAVRRWRLAARAEQARRLRTSLENRSRRAGDGGDASFVPVFSPDAYAIVRGIPADLLDAALSDPNPELQGTEGSQDAASAISVAHLPASVQAAVSRMIERFADSAPPQYAEAAARTRLLASNPGQLSVELWANDAKSAGGATLRLGLVTPNGNRMLSQLLATGPGASVYRSPLDDTIGARRGARTPDAHEQSAIEIPEGTYRYDHAVVLAARKLGIRLVSDYFTRDGLVTIRRQERLSELLQELERRFGCVHAWRGDTLLLQSLDRDDRELDEPLASVTELLEKASGGSGPSLEDLLEAVQRSDDRQLATLQFHTGPGGRKLPPAFSARLGRNSRRLRAFARLSADERSLATRNGLALESLPDADRPVWRAALLSVGIQELRGVVLHVEAEPGAPRPFADWPRVPAVSLLEGRSGKRQPFWRQARVF